MKVVVVVVMAIDIEDVATRTNSGLWNTSGKITVISAVQLILPLMSQ